MPPLRLAYRLRERVVVTSLSPTDSIGVSAFRAIEVRPGGVLALLRGRGILPCSRSARFMPKPDAFGTNDPGVVRLTRST
jgi:hypothetical protein